MRRTILTLAAIVALGGFVASPAAAAASPDGSVRITGASSASDGSELEFGIGTFGSEIICC
ncbi:hypothetical protein [Nonomuraea sp. NPDC049158]|uniref:hypothetical protein n=1 Tax=Nonomuraea sp. NPDC049158 TaxID=3155649 RepID=UPI0033DA9AFE